MSHFKSVVHAREARLGCGISIKPGDGTYVVAHYSLGPGTQFKLNDFSPLQDVGIRKQPGNTQVVFTYYLSIYFLHFCNHRSPKLLYEPSTLH